MIEETWRESAACRGMDTRRFMPQGKGQTAIAHAAAAKLVCRGCPVRLKCLAYAVRNRESVGIYGGISFSVKTALRSAEKLLAHYE